jgi:hypothetical protein
MDALGRSADLLRHSDDVRARSARIRADAAKRRAAAAERVEKSKRLIADAAKIHGAVMLRRASQRSNVKVRELAAQIVEHVACGDSHGNVTPITLGAGRKYQRSEMRARPPAG